MTPAQSKHYSFLQERAQHHLAEGNPHRATHISGQIARAVLRNHRDPSSKVPVQSPGIETSDQPSPLSVTAAPSAPTPPPLSSPKPLLPVPDHTTPALAPATTTTTTTQPPASEPGECIDAEGGIGGRIDHGDHAAQRFDILFQAAELSLEMEDLQDSRIFFDGALQVLAHHPDAVDRLEVAHVHHNYASLFDNGGDVEQAEQHYQTALDILDQIDPPPLRQIANAANNLAMFARDRGEFEQAEKHYLRALEMFEELHGPEDMHVAVVCNNLGTLYWLWHQPEKARDLHRRALGVRRNILDENHPDIGQSACNLAAAHHDLGDFEKAEKNYLRGLKILGQHLDDEADSYQAVAENYAELLKEHGDEKKATQLLEKVAKQVGTDS